MLVELFSDNEGHLTGYKNDLVWTFIEMNASTIIEEYEDVTCQELSELDEDVYPNLVELGNSEFYKDGHYYDNLKQSLGEVVNNK